MVRSLWESGDYTFSMLSQQWGVSVSRLKQKSCEEYWEKGKLKQKVQKKIEEKTVDMLARLGMPKEEFMKMVIDGAKETMCMRNVKRAFKADDGKTVMIGQKPLIVDQTVSVVDNEAILRYRDMIAKLAGWYAPPKSAIQIATDEKDEIPILLNIQPKSKNEP